MALTLVQHKVSSNNANTSNVSCNITASLAGSILVVVIDKIETSPVNNIFDNFGGGINTYTQIPNCVASYLSTRTDIWWCKNPTPGVVTVTANVGPTGSYMKEIYVFEVAGFINPGLELGGFQNQVGAISQVASAPSITTAKAVGFGVAICSPGTGITQNPKTGNEFSAGGDVSANFNSAASCITSVAGLHQAQFLLTTASENYCAACAFIQETQAQPVGQQMPNLLLSPGPPINLIANQVYALPPRACYYAVTGTAPTVSVDGTNYAAPPAAPGPLVANFIKSTAADTFITLKRL